MFKERFNTIFFSKNCERISLLIVDDDVASIRLISSYFKDYFKKIETTLSPIHALEIFEREKIDVLITDISMPEMNGIELAKRIKAVDKNVNIIVTTNFTDSSYLFDAIKIGINSYLSKPLDMVQLANELANISESIYAKEKIKNSESLLEQYRYAMDCSTILSKTDPKGIITYANDRFCEISGYSKEELIGEAHSMIRHPDMPKEVFAQLWETIKEKKIWKGVVKNRKKNGSFYIVDATIIPILNKSGEVVEYIAARHDITELESYKELLKNQLDSSKKDLRENMHFMAQYEKAIDAGSAFCRTDIQKNITYANETFCKMLEFTKEQLLGMHYYDISERRFFEENQKEIEEKIHNNLIWQGIFRHRKKSGALCYTSSTFVPITSFAGEVVEIMRIHTDITEIINLSHEIEATQKEIVVTLGSIGEMRSKETAHHVKRVALYSQRLGEKYGLQESELELLKLASPMHDIGKVAIPDKILNKPGKLDEEEFAMIKKHTLLGYEMLKGSNREILKSAAIIALEHHEKWNGHGYPYGKKGEETHIFGRITAIADVYDALISKRCYKEAWTHKEVCELIKKERGEAFEPKLVDIFLEESDYFLQIKEQYRDEL